MRIPWPTDGGPILFQHGFEYLQARRDDQRLELGLRINEDIDQRQVPWRRGYRLATARDCARLLLHGGSLLGGLHLGFVTGRIARPVKSRRFKFQQLLGHPPGPSAEACTKQCVSKGSAYALIVDDNFYKLDASDAIKAQLSELAGKMATVTGNVMGTDIKVSSVKASG